MRPGDFSPGNMFGDTFTTTAPDASMRPGDFSPGNFSQLCSALGLRIEASMRPGDFSPGNLAGRRHGRLEPLLQ